MHHANAEVSHRKTKMPSATEGLGCDRLPALYAETCPGPALCRDPEEQICLGCPAFPTNTEIPASSAAALWWSSQQQDSSLWFGCSIRSKCLIVRRASHWFWLSFFHPGQARFLQRFLPFLINVFKHQKKTIQKTRNHKTNVCEKTYNNTSIWCKSILLNAASM